MVETVKKAVQTWVIAVLVAIVVIALTVQAYLIIQLNSPEETGKGEANIVIESIAWDESLNQVIITLRNTGTVPTLVTDIYVKHGSQDVEYWRWSGNKWHHIVGQGTLIEPTGELQLKSGSTCTVIISFIWTPGYAYTFGIIHSNCTIVERTELAPEKTRVGKGNMVIEDITWNPCSYTITIRIKNTGSISLLITDIYLKQGTDIIDYWAYNGNTWIQETGSDYLFAPSPLTIPVGGSVTIQIQFKEGWRSGYAYTLKIISSSGAIAERTEIAP